MRVDPNLLEQTGQFGRAFRVDLPDRPEFAETVRWWIVNSPWWTPAWSQYLASVVRLRSGIPGFPEPELRFPGATHELLVVVLDPRHGLWNRKRVVAEQDHLELPFLYPLEQAPLDSRTAKIGDGMLAAPWLSMVRGNNYPQPVGSPMPPITTAGWQHGLTSPEPFVTALRRNARPAPAGGDVLDTVTAGGNHHGLAVPDGAFVQKHHGDVDYPRPDHMVKAAAGDPMPAVVVRPNLSLVIPYRRGRASSTARPLHTVAVKASAGLLTADQLEAIDVDDCWFRMLTPEEHARAQRFPHGYVITGNKSERTAQAGNAVSVNVAQHFGRIIRWLLGERAA